MKHICITGYNSFIGKNFYKKYKNTFKILPYKKNINNLNELKRFIQNKKITHLVNFAGLSRIKCEENKIDCLNTNFKSIKKIINFLNKFNDKPHFIFISTNNINSIPPTLISRFHKHKFPMPKKEEVRAFLEDIKLDLNEGIKNFISFNPWLIEQGEDHELLSKIKNFDGYIKTKSINTKDKIEIEAFVDYLVFINKNNTKNSPKTSLKNLEKLIDIKKSIRSPNNLSMDIARLRISSCL